MKKILRYLFATNSAIWFEKDLSGRIPEINNRIPLDINFNSRQETINWLKQRKECWMFNKLEIEVGLKEEHYFPNIKYLGKIIGYIKLAVGKVYIDDYKKVRDLPEGKAFLYDIYVAPEYRKHNVASYAAMEAMKFLKNKGIRTMGCHIPPWNIASLKVFTKLGFRKVSYIRHFRIFGIRFNYEKSI